MSSNRKKSISKLLRKIDRLQHFCLKMGALEKWCVNNVAHCIPTIVKKLHNALQREVFPEKRVFFGGYILQKMGLGDVLGQVS